MTDDNRITLKNIERGHLCRVLDWYNSGDVYRYATGFDGHVTLKTLEEKFDTINSGDNEFFLGIYRNRDGLLAGTIIGSFSKSVLWIRLLAVAPELRRMGFGSQSAVLLMKYFKEINNAAECFLSVVEENEAGRLFWLKNGFSEAGRIEKRTLFDGAEHNIIIMYKKL